MSLMEQRLMLDPLDIREITFTNLLLLGFEPAVFQTKYSCPFNRDVFAYPNKKAMETVFHFLFTKLNPDVTRDEFRNCWPILDKKQESSFRKVAVGWLNRISKESHDSHIPRIVASVLLSPGGDKFYQLLFCFSSYVLKEEIKKLSGKHEIILPWPSNSSATKSLLHQMSKVLTTKTVVETERFLKTAQLSTTAQDQWVLYASDLTKENRAIRKKKREVEKRLKEVEAEHLQRGLLSPASRQPNGSPFTGQMKGLKRTKILQRVRESWKRIAEVYESHKVLRGRVDEIMKGTANKHCLKGSDIELKIPDLLIRECEDEIHQRRIGNTIESGQINLLSLVQLWNLSLHLILEQIKAYPLPSVAEEEIEIREQLHAQSAYLQSTQSLKEILEKETIPELRDSIEELQEMIEMANTLKSQRTPKVLRSFDFSLTGLPATPSVHLNPGQEHGQMSTAFTKELFSGENLLTPEAIERMIKSLKDATLMQSPEDENMKHEKPPQPKSVRNAKRNQQTARPKIPVPKAKTTARQRTKPTASQRDSSFADATPLRHATPRRTHQQDDNNEVANRMFDPSSALENETKIPSRPKSDHSFVVAHENKARDILAEKIASSVFSQEVSTGSSSSSRSATPLEHGLEDPISAIDEGAFQPKDKIPRTPLAKEIISGGPSPFALESYLTATSNKEVATPGEPVRLFSDSYMESPQDITGASVFDTPVHHHSRVVTTPVHPQSSIADFSAKPRTAAESRSDNAITKTDNLDLTPLSHVYRVNVDITPEQREGLALYGDDFAKEFSSPFGTPVNPTPLVQKMIESSVTSSLLRPAKPMQSDSEVDVYTPLYGYRKEAVDSDTPFVNETNGQFGTQSSKRIRGSTSARRSKDFSLVGNDTPLSLQLKEKDKTLTSVLDGDGLGLHSSMKNDLAPKVETGDAVYHDLLDSLHRKAGRTSAEDITERTKYETGLLSSPDRSHSSPHTSESKGLNGDHRKISGTTQEPSTQNRNNISSGASASQKRVDKEHIADLIKRFKILKSRSKAMADYSAKSDYSSGAEKSNNDELHSDVVKEKHDSFTRESSVMESPTKSNGSKQPYLSLDDSIRETPIITHNSLLEIARSSAQKEIVSWADLQRSFADDEAIVEDDIQGQVNKHLTDTVNVGAAHEHDSFDDLQIPVAQQLSFLQMDTRDLTRVSDLSTGLHLSVSRGGSILDKDFAQRFTPPGGLGTSEGNAEGQRLSEDTQKFATTNPVGVHGRDTRMVNRNITHFEDDRVISVENTPISRVFHTSDRQNIAHFGDMSHSNGLLHVEAEHPTSIPARPSLKFPSSSIQRHNTDKALDLKSLTHVRGESRGSKHSMLATPQSRPLHEDEDFNLLTPGLNLRRGIEMFAEEFESPDKLQETQENKKSSLVMDEQLIDLS